MSQTFFAWIKRALLHRPLRCYFCSNLLELSPRADALFCSETCKRRAIHSQSFNV